MLNGPFSPWPAFTDEEANAARDVLLSGKVNYWTGQEGREFEAEFAAFAGTKHAIALANGTVALDLALQGLGIGAAFGGSELDEVIVTPRSFIASASSVVNAGARPVFADVDKDSQNITGATVEPLLTNNTKAIICVHLAGWPCDMDALRALAAPRGIKLIEDCAQAHGAQLNGVPVGGLGDVAAWSFCQDKIMTTGGEGGMITCNDETLWRRMWAFKDHGKSWEAVYERDHKLGFRWLHESIGTNWRLTEMQSAIGRIQLKRMQDWQAARTANANAILDAARANPLFRVPETPNAVTHAYYKAYVFVNGGAELRDRIIAQVNAKGVPCFSGSCSEIYREKAFGSVSERLPVAQELGETSLMFLVHPSLTEAEIAKTVDLLSEFCKPLIENNRDFKMSDNKPEWLHLADQGDFLEALKLCKADTQENRDQFGGDYMISHFCIHLKKFAEALPYLNKVLSSHPDNYSVHLSKFNCLVELGEKHLAFLQALEMHPFTPETLDQEQTITHDQYRSFSRMEQITRYRRKFGRTVLAKNAPILPRILYYLHLGEMDAVSSLIKELKSTSEMDLAVSNFKSVDQFIRSGGGEYVFQGHCDKISFPKVGNLFDDEDSTSSTLNSNKPYVGVLSNMFVHSESTVVFDKNGTAVSDVFSHEKFGKYVSLRGDPVLASRSGEALIHENMISCKYIQQAIHMSGSPSSHFGHWFAEFLPKLRHFEQLKHFSEIPIIVNDSMPDTHFDFLNAVSNNPLIRIKKNEVLNVNKLFVAPTITFSPFFPISAHEVPQESGGSWSAPAMQYIRTKILQFYGPLKTEKRKIYLSRKNSSWGLVNAEDRLEEFLASMGLDTVTLETMPFEEQVRTMQGAEFIIAPTGSALNSVIFSDFDTKVLVLSQSATHNWGGWLGPIRELGFDPKFLLTPVDENASKHRTLEFELEDVERAIRAVVG
jgi:dTDP-4-amino-4,6-dideoxygalactose transaminase